MTDEELNDLRQMFNTPCIGLRLIAEIDRLRREVMFDKGEIERLRAIVDALPTTADGVPVVPGMTVSWPGHFGTVSLVLHDSDTHEYVWWPERIYAVTDAAKGDSK